MYIDHFNLYQIKVNCECVRLHTYFIFLDWSWSEDIIQWIYVEWLLALVFQNAAHKATINVYGCNKYSYQNYSINQLYLSAFITSS